MSPAAKAILNSSRERLCDRMDGTEVHQSCIFLLSVGVLSTDVIEAIQARNAYFLHLTGVYGMTLF